MPKDRRSAAGFTLLEIIVVVALIAALSAAIASAIGAGLGGARIRGAARELVAALRYTRGQAIVKRQSQVLTLDVEQRRYQAPGRAWTDLPKQMELSLLTARNEQRSDGIAGVRFFPDGSSTGGNIKLIAGEAQWRINVGWLTGEVDLVAANGE